MPATLTLTSPDSETHAILTQSKTRRTAGLQLREVKPVTWELLDGFAWVFRGLSESQRDDFIIFVCDNAGQTIIVDDHKGDRWVGIITSNPTIQQTHRTPNADGSDCKTGDDGSLWEVSFEFQGVHE